MNGDFTVTTKCPLRTGPGKTYSAKTTLSVGIKGSVIKYTYNSAGKKWYYITRGAPGWAYSGNLSVKPD